MARRFPPLNALRTFEAAARHLSFSGAARDLSVTPAAVSHQIKALEDWLGAPLFSRGKREVALTTAGQAYYPALAQAFDIIAAATERLMAPPDHEELRVTAAASFVAKWLMPRLPRFRRAHPDIDVLMSSSNQLVDITEDRWDIGIRFGRGVYPGLVVDPLFGDDMFPVCSPALLADKPVLDQPADLRHHTLLHDDAEIGWDTWLKAAGVDDFKATRGPMFDDSAMVVQAAIDGQGVALARGALVKDDLDAGRLVRPFDFSLPADWGYYMVYNASARNRPHVMAFRDWLLAEAAKIARLPVAPAGPRE